MNARLFAFSLVAAVAAAGYGLEVLNVTARPRWPWENVIDIDFDVSGGGQGAVYAVEVDAVYSNGTRKVAASTFLSEPIAVPGANRISWDIGKDAKDVAADDLNVRVAVSPVFDDTPVYCVVDLSGGHTAETWPVRYTFRDPEHVKGATNEPCQTTEMWFRRIPAKDRVFIMGYFKYRGDGVNYREYYAKLTNDFYIAIFETTQQQYYQMTGTWPSAFSNELYRASRPADSLLHNDLRVLDWPTVRDPGAGKPITIWRQKTGLATLDLPTETQWEFCAQSDMNNGSREFWRYGNIADIARYKGNNGDWNGDYDCDLSAGTAAVGSYEPNKWGIYDLLGNVKEMVQDARSSDNGDTGTKAYYLANGLGGTSVDDPVVDPVGPPRSFAGVTAGNHVIRGGAFNQGSDYSLVFWRGGQDWIRTNRDGFRLVFTVK
jgi:formylglycine-generating enzyme required for sulfatase activity